MDLFREKHTTQTECGPPQKVRKACLSLLILTTSAEVVAIIAIGINYLII